MYLLLMVRTIRRRWISKGKAMLAEREVRGEGGKVSFGEGSKKMTTERFGQPGFHLCHWDYVEIDVDDNNG